MPKNDTTLARISEVSDTCSRYIANQIYLDEYTPTYELLVTCINICIDELKEIGILFVINVEDILDNPNNIDALISIKEYFDESIFKEVMLTVDKDIISLLNSVLISNDVIDGDIIHSILEICTHHNLGDKNKLDSIEYIKDNIESSLSLKVYIARILSSLPEKSDITDDQLILYTSLLPHVEKVIMYWNKVFKHITDKPVWRDLNISQELIDKYLTRYISLWMDPKNSERYIWILNNGNSDDRQLAKVHYTLLQRHWENTPCNIAYHIKKGHVSTDEYMTTLSCIVHEVLMMLSAQKVLGEDTSKLFSTTERGDISSDVRTNIYTLDMTKRFKHIMLNLHLIMGTADDDIHMQNMRNACINIVNIDIFKKDEV